MSDYVLTALSPELALVRQPTSFSARNALAQEALREESAAPATEPLLPGSRSLLARFRRGRGEARLDLAAHRGTASV